MTPTPQENIESIYKEKTANDALARDLSGALKIISNTVFGQVKHIVHELLQNADDAKASEVSINICGGHLIFSHNGGHFSDNDVRAVSSIGSGESLKTENIEKTGFKGVGFKAVFGRSDCVYIISDQYSFRFDKIHWKDKTDYPWQVIPVWTSNQDIPHEINGEYTSSLVNVILRLTDANSVQEELLELFKKPLLMLFLRHVNKINVKNNGKEIHNIIRKKTPEGHLQIIDGNKLLYEYLTKSWSRQVPEIVRTNISLLADDVCPPKIKNATDTTITLAIFITKEKRLDTENTYPIYCYLPTSLDLKFSFLINGDFLTNAERTDLLGLEWNSFILGEVARCFFDWVEELAKNPSYRLDLPALLRMPATQETKLYLKEYNKTFNQIVPKKLFIPSEGGAYLMNIPASLLDQSGISKTISAKYLLALFPNVKYIVDEKVMGKTKLKTLGCHEFTIDQIGELLIQPQFIQEYLIIPENCASLLNYFREKTHANTHAILFQKLKVANILLNQHGELKNAREVYFPFNNENENSWIELSFLHPEITKKVLANQDFYIWIDSLGVKYPKEEDVFRKSIIPMIESNSVNITNALNVARFAFRLYLNQKLTDNDYSSLMNLPLLLFNDTLANPKDCLLPNYYQPEFQFESFLPNGSYISQNYPENREHIPLWQSFLKRLGVKDRFTIMVHRQGIRRRQMLELAPDVQAYLTYLDNSEVYPSNTSFYRDTQHTIEGFYWPELFEHASTYSFSKILWKHLFEQWELIKEMEARTVYKTMISTNKIDSFFKFYLSRFPCVPGSDLQCHIATELYSPSLKTILGDSRTCANFEFELTVEQEKWLGLKTTLTIADCISLLSIAAGSPLKEDSQKQIIAIYRQLITYTKQGGTIDILQDHNRANILLPAYNDSFQSINQLYGFGIKNVSAPVGSQWFLKAGTLKPEDYEKLCTILGLQIVTDESLRYNRANEKPDLDLPSLLRDRCKFLAILTAKLHARYYTGEYQNLYTLIFETKFKVADSMELLFMHDDKTIIYQQKMTAWQDANCFYYNKKWRNPTTWINLKYKLAEWLGLQGKEDWLDIVLLEDKSGIIEWLKDHGYEIPETPEFSIGSEPEPSYDTSNKTNGAPTTENTADSFNLKETEAVSFIPAFKPAQIDLSTIKVTKHTKRISETTVSSEIMQNAQNRSDVGRWGEELVFRKKIEELSAQYTGFTFTEIDGVAKWTNNRKIVELTWVNCIRETGKPYDLILEDGTDSYIEVKTTPSNEKTVVYISGPEWQFMMEKGKTYSIYRVFNAGTVSPKIYEISNPALKITNGQLLPVKIELAI